MGKFENLSMTWPQHGSSTRKCWEEGSGGRRGVMLAILTGQIQRGCQKSGQMPARQGRGSWSRCSSCCQALWLGSPRRGKNVQGEERPTTLPHLGSFHREERKFPACCNLSTLFLIISNSSLLTVLSPWTECIKTRKFDSKTLAQT